MSRVPFEDTAGRLSAVAGPATPGREEYSGGRSAERAGGGAGTASRGVDVLSLTGVTAEQ